MTTTYLTAAQTAALVRKSLKEAFPKTKFSVRAHRGSSINIDWQDGPTPAQVDSIADRFNGSYFDGMIDFKGSIHHQIDGKDVRLGADFIFTHRSNSDAAVASAIDSVYADFKGNFERDGLDKPSVEDFRNGRLYRVQLSGYHHHGNQSVQHDIHKRLSETTDIAAPLASPTAASVVVTGDDGYSRKHGSGFSALAATATQ